MVLGRGEGGGGDRGQRGQGMRHGTETQGTGAQLVHVLAPDLKICRACGHPVAEEGYKNAPTCTCL